MLFRTTFAALIFMLVGLAAQAQHGRPYHGRRYNRRARRRVVVVQPRPRPVARPRTVIVVPGRR